MIPVIKFYVKVFLFFGLFLFALSLLLDLIFRSPLEPMKYLFNSAFAGFLFSAFTVTFHIITLWLMGIRKFTDDTLSVKQKKTITAPVSLHDLIIRIQSDPVLNKMDMKTSNDRIELKPDMGWASWGEKISIISHPMENQMTGYEITSAPKLKFTLLDGGKNLKNIMRISKLLGVA